MRASYRAEEKNSNPERVRQINYYKLAPFRIRLCRKESRAKDMTADVFEIYAITGMVFGITSFVLAGVLLGIIVWSRWHKMRRPYHKQHHHGHFDGEQSSQIYNTVGMDISAKPRAYASVDVHQHNRWLFPAVIAVIGCSVMCVAIPLLIWWLAGDEVHQHHHHHHSDASSSASSLSGSVI